MNMVIKVADFGLAVNTGDKSYYRISSETDIKLPVMWMAPESLSTQTFSEKSDIVSVFTKINVIIRPGQSLYIVSIYATLYIIVVQNYTQLIKTNSAASK